MVIIDCFIISDSMDIYHELDELIRSLAWKNSKTKLAKVSELDRIFQNEIDPKIKKYGPSYQAFFFFDLSQKIKEIHFQNPAGANQ